MVIAGRKQNRIFVKSQKNTPFKLSHSRNTTAIGRERGRVRVTTETHSEIGHELFSSHHVTADLLSDKILLVQQVWDQHFQMVQKVWINFCKEKAGLLAHGE